MKFKEWFETRLEVGPYPMINSEDKADYNSFDIVVNVSDEFYPDIDARLRSEFGCVTHWFPMNETGHDNGVNSIYGACWVLRLSESAGMSAYLHCHAGRHRSRVVQAAYHFMRSNSHFGGFAFEGYDTALHYDCANGYLPPLCEMEAFLGKVAKYAGNAGLENTKRFRLSGGALDHSKNGKVKAYRLPGVKIKRARRATEKGDE